jgi:hypothetical protein
MVTRKVTAADGWGVAVGPPGVEGVFVDPIKAGMFASEKVQPLSNRGIMLARDKRLRMETRTGFARITPPFDFTGQR